MIRQLAAVRIRPANVATKVSPRQLGLVFVPFKPRPNPNAGFHEERQYRTAPTLHWDERKPMCLSSHLFTARRLPQLL